MLTYGDDTPQLTESDRQRDTSIGRQTDRQRDGQTESPIGRQTVRWADRESNRQRYRQADRQSDKQTDSQFAIESDGLLPSAANVTRWHIMLWLLLLRMLLLLLPLLQTAVAVCLSGHSSLDAAGVLSLCQIDASALEIRIICCCCCCCCCDDLQLLLALACKALIA